VYIGYLALGGATINDERFEIINSDRCLAYVDHFNDLVRSGEFDPGFPCIDWIAGCDTCPGYGDVFAPGASYISPDHDPAPWFDPYVRDSERLLETLHAVMHARFGIDHTTIQLEMEPSAVLRIQGPSSA